MRPFVAPLRRSPRLLAALLAAYAAAWLAISQLPLAPALLKLQQRLKQQFDPHLIFNPGRMYPEL